jgi:transcription elongation factor Elf1
MIAVPHYINERESDIRAIKPGWYTVKSNGKLSSGPFSSYEECLTGIAEARSLFRASPWLAQAIKCPECGGEHVRPCTRLDEDGRVWMDNSCETCGHTLSLEEISRHVVNQIASHMSQAMEDTR